MTEVYPNLFISALPEETPCPKYRAIVSLLTPPLSSYSSVQHLAEGIAHLQVSLSDSDDALLLPHLTACVRFIHERIDSPILVHCFHGVSRSVAVCLAYISVVSLLSSSSSLSSESTPSTPSPDRIVSDALAKIREQYPQAHPSHNFTDQIVAFVAYASLSTKDVTNISFPPSPSSQLDSLPPHLVNTVLRLASVSLKIDVFSDLCIDTPGAGVPRRDFVCCANCAIPLLPLNAILNPHRLPKDEILVYPIKWMGEVVINTSQSRIRCPSCDRRLGCFVRGDIHRAIPSRFSLTPSTVDVPLGGIEHFINGCISSSTISRQSFAGTQKQ